MSWLVTRPHLGSCWSCGNLRFANQLIIEQLTSYNLVQGRINVKEYELNPCSFKGVRRRRQHIQRPVRQIRSQAGQHRVEGDVVRRRPDCLTLTRNEDTLTGEARARAHSNNNHLRNYDGRKKGEFQCKKGSKEWEKEGSLQATRVAMPQSRKLTTPC